MLNLLPRAQVPRKAGAKLQQFHESTKYLSFFYQKYAENSHFRWPHRPHGAILPHLQTDMARESLPHDDGNH